MTRNLLYLTAMLLTPAALLAGDGPVVPEPGTMLLMGAGLGAVILLARKKRSGR